MIRRLARKLLGPFVRWAAAGWIPNVYVVRDHSGCYLGFVGAFNEGYLRPMDLTGANLLADDLLSEAYNAAEGIPLPPDFGGK